MNKKQLMKAAKVPVKRIVRRVIDGRPRFEINDYEELERLGALHLTKEEISIALGCCKQTLFLRQQEDPRINEAIMRGRLKGKHRAVTALDRKIEEGDTASILFALRCKYGFSETLNLGTKDDEPLKILIEHVGRKYIEKNNGEIAGNGQL